mmetsp:Transcript_30300/g.97669  ORF Transcript_30300/g.97669 Transcript_30300/m.97669 type:complete len:741 (-) Transcript_30300:68-2290(-)
MRRRLQMAVLLFAVLYVVWLSRVGTPLEEEETGGPPAPRRQAGMALARQYALLTRLGHPPKVPSSPSFTQVKTSEKHRARSRAANWVQKRDELRRRCARRGGGERRRHFLTSTRKDFQGYISEELMELGLCPSSSSNGSVDFYVGEQFGPATLSKEERRRLARNRHATLGSIDGLMETFGLKNSYAELFWHCFDLHASQDPRRLLCPQGWLPSFNVDGDQTRGSLKFKSGRIDKKDVPRFDDVFGLVTSRRTTTTTYWIVKPQKGTWLSRGMHVAPLTPADLATKTKFLTWISRAVLDDSCLSKKYEAHKCDRREVTFQLYVGEPASFYDRKFDLRVWVAITSLDPFRLFLLRHAYPKVASRPFSLGDIDDQCRHIKMLLDPECNVTLREFKSDFPYDFPRSTASPVFFAGVRFPGLSSAAAAVAPDHEKTAASLRKKGGGKFRPPRKGQAGRPPLQKRRRRRLLLQGKNASLLLLGSSHDDEKSRRNRRHNEDPAEKRRTATRNWPLKEQFWSRRIWPSLESTVATAALLARRNLTAPLGKTHPVFALLSPDVTLDERGRLFVEEINTNGLVMGTHQHGGGSGNLFFDDGYVRDFLTLVGADDYPRKMEYADELEDAVANFCGGGARQHHECDDVAKAEIRRAVHQEAHAGPHWYRLYPPISCFADDCLLEEGNHHDRSWPLQGARFDDAHLAAFGETHLDTIVREFLTETDTEAIHGVTQVPGHGRWPPRDFDGTSSL